MVVQKQGFLIVPTPPLVVGSPVSFLGFRDSSSRPGFRTVPSDVARKTTSSTNLGGLRDSFCLFWLGSRRAISATTDFTSVSRFYKFWLEGSPLSALCSKLEAFRSSISPREASSKRRIRLKYCSSVDGWLDRTAAL